MADLHQKESNALFAGSGIRDEGISMSADVPSICANAFKQNNTNIGIVLVFKIGNVIHLFSLNI